MKTILPLLGVCVVACAAARPAAAGVTFEQANAIATALTVHDPHYKGAYVDPIPGDTDPGYYSFELLAIKPMPASQHIETLEIDRDTGAVWRVRGSDCSLYKGTKGAADAALRKETLSRKPAFCD
jgi:hypothetical protein